MAGIPIRTEAVVYFLRDVPRSPANNYISLGLWEAVRLKVHVADADVKQRRGLGVVAVQRGARVFENPESDFELEVGDVLVVFGSCDRIAAFEAQCGQVGEAAS